MGKPTNTSTSSVGTVLHLSIPKWSSVQNWGQQNSTGGQPQLQPTHAWALQPPPSVKFMVMLTLTIGWLWALESTRDYDRDSTMDISEDDTNQGANESDTDSDSWESAADFGPESATGDNCLSCLDTEEAIVKSTHKRFHEKVWASCSPAKQGLWRMPSWSGSAVGTRWCGEVTMKPSEQSRISLLVRTTAPLKWAGWWSKLTSCSGLKRLPAWRTSTPMSIKLKSMGGRRPWCSHWSSSMLTTTGCMRRAWPMPWSACRAFTWVMLSGVLTSPLVWGWSHSAPGPQTGQKHGDDCHPTPQSALPDKDCVQHLLGICHHDCTEYSRPSIVWDVKWSTTKSIWSMMPMKGTESLRSPTSLSLPSWKKLTRNHAEQNATLCLPHSHLVNPVNECLL